MGCGYKRITGWYVCEYEQHQFHSPVTSVYFLHVGTCQWKKPFIFYCCFSHHSFPLCFGARLRKTLRLCVCVCVYTPSHLVTSEATTRIPHCQENPRLAGITNAYTRIRDSHDFAHLHMFFDTRGLHIYGQGNTPSWAY